MKSLLLLLTGVLCLSTSVWGLSYTCRDSKGTKYFADSPLRLPASCEGDIWQFEQQKFLDNATSATETAPALKPKKSLFKQMIKEDSLARKFGQLEQQAADAVRKYEEGAELLNLSKRRWHYGLRAPRKEKGLALIRDAQQAKQGILNDLETSQLSTQKQNEIEKQLEPIH